MGDAVTWQALMWGMQGRWAAEAEAAAALAEGSSSSRTVLLPPGFRAATPLEQLPPICCAAGWQRADASGALRLGHAARGRQQGCEAGGAPVAAGERCVGLELAGAPTRHPCPVAAAKLSPCQMSSWQ